MFHCSVGPSHEDRYIVISIHSDGFEYVDELQQYPPAESRIPVRQCRPWFHRTDHESAITDDENEGTPIRAGASSKRTNIHPFVKEQTKRAKAQIEALIDQPGTCLRDDIDAIDFHVVDGQDLSDIPPPSLHDNDSYMLVDTADKMKQCARELQEASPTEIAFDMEMYNLSKYTQVTCLFQLSSNATTRDYVIDTLAPGVWDHVSLLAPLFADPTIVKVGHAIGSMDIPSLHRDFGIFVVNAFDTFEASKVLRQASGNGLASVCESYGLANVERYHTLKAQYQNTDWRVRPLTDEMIQYGRYDIHYLLALRKLMIRDLTREELWDNVGSNKEAERRMIAKALASTIKRMEQEEDGYGDDSSLAFENAIESSSSLDTSMASRLSSFSDDDDGYYTPPAEEDPNADVTRQSEYGAQDLRMQADLMTVITHSQQRCLELWSAKSETITKNDNFISVIYRAGKGELEWTPSNMALYEDLCHWRDTVAKKEGVLPGLVCPLDWLVDIAVKRPPSEMALRRITYYLPTFVEGSNGVLLQEILSLVRNSLEKDGMSKICTVRKYNPPTSDRKALSRGRRVALSLVAVAAIGAVAAVVVTMSRKKTTRW